MKNCVRKIFRKPTKLIEQKGLNSYRTPIHFQGKDAFKTPQQDNEMKNLDSSPGSKNLSPKQQALKRNKTPLSRYLKNYETSFNKSIDEIWDKYDVDKNGWLDKSEAKNFIDAVAKKDRNINRIGIVQLN